MNKIQEEIMKTYQTFYTRIDESTNSSNPDITAAQLTAIYYGLNIEPKPNLENVIPIKFTGGLNGSKY